MSEIRVPVKEFLEQNDLRVLPVGTRIVTGGGQIAKITVAQFLGYKYTFEYSGKDSEFIPYHRVENDCSVLVE